MNASYINYLKADHKSENTIKTYIKNIDKFLKTVDKPENEVTFLDICDYQASLENLSANSVRIQLASLKSYFQFLVKAKVINEDPTDGVKKPKSNPKVKQYMTSEDIEAMINACRTNRDVAIIKFMVSTGVRISEMSSITLDDYYEAINTDHEITIVGKGNKERNIFINPSVEEAVNYYLSNRYVRCEYLFASFRETRIDEESMSRTLKTTAHNAGLSYWKEISPHWLRAAFATIANSKGYDVKAISEAMGHSSIAVTSVYLKTTQSRVNNVMSGMAF